MPLTLPEGVQITPSPMTFGPPTPVPPSRSLLIVLSITLGMVIALGTIASGLGNAYFVGRSEYTQQTLQAASEKVSAAESLKRIDLALARQEAALEKLSTSVEAIKQEVGGRYRR
jgi:hypothetical protein